jgi:hypothetical protein
MLRVASAALEPSASSEVAAFSPLSEFFTSWAMSEEAVPSAAIFSCCVARVSISRQVR